MKFKKGDRIVVETAKGVFIGTVQKSGASIDVVFDDGDMQSYKSDDKRIIGPGIEKQRKKAIPSKDVKKWLAELGAKEKIRLKREKIHPIEVQVPAHIRAKMERYLELMDEFEELNSELNEVKTEQKDLEAIFDKELGREFKQSRALLVRIKERTLKFLKSSKSYTPWKKLYENLYDQVNTELQAAMDKMQKAEETAREYMQVTEVEGGFNELYEIAKRRVVDWAKQFRGLLKRLNNKAKALLDALPEMTNAQNSFENLPHPVYDTAASLIIEGRDKLAHELLQVIAAGQYKKEDRIIVETKHGLFLGTVTAIRSGKLYVELDNGERKAYPLRSKFLMGRGTKKVRKTQIPREFLNKYLTVPRSDFPKITKKAVTPKGRGKEDVRTFKAKNGRTVKVPRYLPSNYRGPMPNYGPNWIPSDKWDMWNEFYEGYHTKWERPQYNDRMRWKLAIRIFKRWAAKYHNWHYTKAFIQAGVVSDVIRNTVESVYTKYRNELTEEMHIELESLVFESVMEKGDVIVPANLQPFYNEIIQLLNNQGIGI